MIGQSSSLQRIISSYRCMIYIYIYNIFIIFFICMLCVCFKGVCVGGVGE